MAKVCVNTVIFFNYFASNGESESNTVLSDV